jgi:hypothetical protein
MISVPLTILFGASSQALSQQSEEKMDERATRLSTMVQSLVNRNAAPTLVRVPGGRMALFSDDYDWTEQARINKVLHVLNMEGREDLWEVLLEHSDDKRYAITVRYDREASNWSVGEVCTQLVIARLEGAYRQHLVESNNPSKLASVDLRSGVDRTQLKQWREARKEKALYELQVEVCENALSDLRNVHDASDTEKAQMRKKIEAEIRKLESSKQPVFLNLGNPELDLYTPELAKSVRERLNTPGK